MTDLSIQIQMDMEIAVMYVQRSMMTKKILITMVYEMHVIRVQTSIKRYIKKIMMKYVQTLITVLMLTIHDKKIVMEMESVISVMGMDEE